MTKFLIILFLLHITIVFSQKRVYGVGISSEFILGVEFKDNEIYKSKNNFGHLSGTNFGINCLTKKNKVIYSLNLNHRVFNIYKKFEQFDPMSDIEILSGEYKTGEYKDGSFYFVDAGSVSYSSLYTYNRRASSRTTQTNLSVNFTYPINNSNVRIGGGVMLNINHNSIVVLEGINNYKSYNINGSNYSFSDGGETVVKTIKYNDVNLAIPITIDYTFMNYNGSYVIPYYSLNISNDVFSFIGIKLGVGF
jgi:hypothetical protein